MASSIVANGPGEACLPLHVPGQEKHTPDTVIAEYDALGQSLLRLVLDGYARSNHRAALAIAEGREAAAQMLPAIREALAV